MFYCENCKITLKPFDISKATSLSKSNTKANEVNLNCTNRPSLTKKVLCRFGLACTSNKETIQ